MVVGRRLVGLGLGRSRKSRFAAKSRLGGRRFGNLLGAAAGIGVPHVAANLSADHFWLLARKMGK